MGYRSYSSGDQGTVTGGSVDVGVVKETFLFGTLHRLYQKASSTVRRYAGVSITDAQSLCQGSATLHNFRMTSGSGTGAAWDTALSCCGTKSRASYARIGDSNLFEVQAEDTTLAVSEDGSNWTSTGNM